MTVFFGEYWEVMIFEGNFIQESIDSKQNWGRNNEQPMLKAKIIDYVTSITRAVDTHTMIVAAVDKSNLRR